PFILQKMKRTYSSAQKGLFSRHFRVFCLPPVLFWPFSETILSLESPPRATSSERCPRRAGVQRRRLMSRVIQVSLGSLMVLFLITVPIALAVHQQAQTRNFRVVRPGVLYRSGQMTKDGLKRILNDYRIKTVVSLRDGMTARDKAE